MQPSRVQLGPYLLRLVLPLGLLLLAAGLLQSTRRLEAYNRSPYPLSPPPRFHPRATLPDEASAQVAAARIPVELTLRRGETAIQVFEQLGLAGTEAREASDALAEHVNLRALKAGNRYSAFFNPDSSLASLQITLDGTGRFRMQRQARSWETSWETFERTVEMRVLSATLDGSFEGAIRTAGGPSMLAYHMADVLRWDLDFTRDLKRGDRFKVLYEQVRMNGQDYAVGNVVALVYDGALGRHQEAYGYGGTGVYYDEEGRPSMKMFLRSPLRYSRITSSFSLHRFHPVLNEFRPHYGVDYGAPVGTPVQVTANGVVVSAGWDGGGGNVVKVRHADGYLTAYLHLSRFAAGIRAGSRVRQGDIIAYTGATGLATGPHLDYRVKHGDQWVDPLGLKGIRAEPIPSYQLASFRNWQETVRASLTSGVVSPSLLKTDLPPAQLASRTPGASDVPADRGVVAAGR
ncbi:MAG TPA: peptidoglycan DD-metalloendopeptidase family protein [Thermoanaerobaculia bacterium]|nr:peptidoglycan DD-metalloendopeptidase family protein [Thermoanaerobaculia bacterium]